MTFFSPSMCLIEVEYDISENFDYLDYYSYFKIKTEKIKTDIINQIK